jgi:TonB family protein
MKKYFLMVLILFTSLMFTLSYASDDSLSGEKAFKPSEVDTPPRVVKPGPLIFPKKKTIDGLIFTEGRVLLKFIVTKDGGVRNPEVIEAVPEGLLEASAIESIKRWKFAPATRKGEPVDCIAKMPMTFNVAGANNTPFDAYEAAQKGLNFIKVEEYNNAVKAFTEAIKISEKYSPGYSGRGMAYMNLKEYEKAIEDFNAAIKISGKIALNYKLRGEAYSAMKDYNTAIKDFDRAIKIEPEMLESYFERGNAFRNLDKYSKAIADYTKVIELDKDYLQAYNNRAAAYNELNDSENMCLDIKKACELNDCSGLELAQKAGKCVADAAGN